MQIEQARIGMQVYFGRSQGEKTLGKIIKLNPTKAKVETLEGRGNGRGGMAGSVWSVPYSMMEPAGGQAGPPWGSCSGAEIQSVPVTGRATDSSGDRRDLW